MDELEIEAALQAWAHIDGEFREALLDRCLAELDSKRRIQLGTRELELVAAAGDASLQKGILPNQS